MVSSVVAACLDQTVAFKPPKAECHIDLDDGEEKAKASIFKLCESSCPGWAGLSQDDVEVGPLQVLQPPPGNSSSVQMLDVHLLVAAAVYEHVIRAARVVC